MKVAIIFGSASDKDVMKKSADVLKEFNIEYVYFEAGSGAEQPVSNEIISAIRKRFTIPIIVGGGINDGETTYQKIQAGAKIIVTGTVLEKNIKNLENIIDTIHTY